MADPFSWAAIGTGASAAGGILNAFGASKKGAAEADMLGYQAGMADLRAKIALQNRDFAFQQGDAENFRYGLKARSQMGAIKVAQAGSGLDVGGDSAKRVREGQQQIIQIDEATIASNTARKAYGYTVDAAVEEEQARMLRKGEANTRSATKLNVLSSLISGASSVASKWSQASTLGIGTGSLGGGPLSLNAEDYA